MATGELPSKLRLRPATPEDRFLIRRWLAEPSIQRWQGNAARAEAEITLAMDSAAALPRIVEREGSPAGYAQAVEIGLWTAQPPQGVPAGAWGVDYFLVATETSDSETGSAVLILLTEEVFATTLALACSAVVSVRNEAAARSYERAGFRWLHVLHDPLFGPSWLMLKERPDPPRAR